jgi:type II secretory pathway component GspD/PulD (secretin)
MRISIAAFCLLAWQILGDALAQEPADQTDFPQPKFVVQVVVAERDSTTGWLDILSRPQFRVADNRTAEIGIGTSPAIISMALGRSFKSYDPLAIQLRVTPASGSEAKVNLRVSMNVKANKCYQIDVGEGGDLESTLIAADGNTVKTKAIPVTMRTTNEHKVPWLSELPVAGGLFRMQTQSISKSEVFVILTPHAFRDPADADQIRARGVQPNRSLHSASTGVGC